MHNGLECGGGGGGEGIYDCTNDSLLHSTGPHILKRSRRDLRRNFGDDFMNYIYHSNAQNPT